MPSPRSAPRTPPKGVPPGEGDALSHNIRSPESSPLEADYSVTIDTSTLVNMADRLRHSPPADCLWLEQEDLKVVGTHPIDAGGFADVWVGELDNRKVVIKSYRCSASADYSRICGASNP
jgi:hypothetical protein